MTPLDHQGITRAVVEAESACGVEVVVVGYGSADSYLDIVFRNALVVTLLALTVVLVAPVEIDHDLVFPIIAVACLAGLLLSRLPMVQRLTSSAGRRGRAIENAVSRSFFMRGVTKTRQRVGLLVVWFELEQAVRVVFDIGLEAKIPADIRAKVSASLQAAMLDGQQRAAAIAAIGPAFAPFLPRDIDDVNELDDAQTTGAA